MSFKDLHINTENIEEYLLLYVDNELTADEMAAVDAFVLIHPQYQAELDLLKQSVLPATNISLPNKLDLKSGPMRAAEMQEQMLLHLDGELPLEASHALQQEIEADRQLAAAWASLQATKLNAGEAFSYPNKKELYRSSALPMATWLPRVAAAVIVTLAAALWLVPSGDDGQPPLARQAQPEKVVTGAQQPETPVVAAIPGREEVPVAPIASMQAPTIPSEKVKAPARNAADVIAEPVITLPAPQKEIALNPITPRTEGVDVTPSKFIAEDVTTLPAVAYNAKETVVDGGADDELKSRGSLKGFLRKATRIIERKTGIGATTDDDRLLIGALALNLE